MPIYILLSQIALILVAGWVFGEIATHFKVPRVIGELCAGIFLGPSVLAFVSPTEPIQLLAEIGIILLLFKVGLDTDAGRLINAGHKAMILAVTGFLTPLILGTGICYYTFGFPMLVSLFVGGTLTATSIGVTVRILEDIGQYDSPEGQIVVGAAVLDDLMGVVLLAILYEFSSTGSIDIAHTIRILVLMLAFFAVAPIIARMFSRLIQRINEHDETSGLIPIAMVSLVLCFAAIAHAVGAPELLGGFAAGIALSRKFHLPFGIALMINEYFNRQIHDQMQPIFQLLTPIFFVMVGISLDLSAVDWSSPFIWIFSLAITVVAVVSKLTGGLLVPENHYARIAIGMAMVPRAEVGLIFAELGRASGIFDHEVYAAMIIAIAYTTLVSPILIKSYYRLFGHHFTESGTIQSGIAE